MPQTHRELDPLRLARLLACVFVLAFVPGVLSAASNPEPPLTSQQRFT